MTTIIKKAIYILLVASTSIYAQVKIGTNPSNIGINSNLEVEATNSKKVIIDKSEGTVQIENLPLGAETDSLVTVGPNGILKHRSVNSLKESIGSPSFSQMTSSSQSLNQGSNTVDFNTIIFNDKSELNLTTNEFIAISEGTYTISYSLIGQIPLSGPVGATGSLTVGLLRNGSSISIFNTPLINRGDTHGINFSVIERMDPGDIIKVVVVPCNGCTVGETDYYVQSSKLSILKN